MPNRNEPIDTPETEADDLLAKADFEKMEQRQLYLEQIWIAGYKEQLKREAQLTKDPEAAAKSREMGDGSEPERDTLDPADPDPMEPMVELALDLQRETTDSTAEPDHQQAIQDAIEANEQRQYDWYRGIKPYYNRETDEVGFEIE